MNKSWSVLLLSLLFAIRAVASPALQSLVTSGLAEPYDVTVDLKNNYYLTDSVNNRIAKYNPSAGALTNLAGVLGEQGSNDGVGAFAHFNSPQGIVYARGGLVVADSGNHLIRFVALNGTVTTLAGSTAGFKDGSGTAAQFNSPAGLAADAVGNVYVADLLNRCVRKIDLANGVTTFATGFLRPTAVTVDKVKNLVYVADSGTHNIRVIQSDGTVSLFAGSVQGISGAKDSLIATNALFNAPRGLHWVGGNTGLLVSDTGNHSVRRVYLNTNYNSFSAETYVSSSLISPIGVTVDNIGNFPLIDLAQGLLSIQVTAPQPPVSNPQIGVVTMNTNLFGDLVTELIPVVSSTFNNDVKVAILAEDGTETFYTLDPDADFPDDPSTRSTPLHYVNGLPEWNNTLVTPSLDGANVLVRAISAQDGRRPSDVISARFQFKVANPVINGKNPGNFTLSDGTDNAEIWYTLDGSDPTNRVPSVFYLPDSHLNVLNGTNNVVFKAQAFKQGYTASSQVSKTFLFTDLETSVIGVTRDFIAGIGSTVIVPVEVRVGGADALRSLQFRVELTPKSGAPAISDQFRSLTFSTNDIIRVDAPSVNPPISEVYATSNIRGLAIAYVGNILIVTQASGLVLKDSAVAAMLAVPIPPTATVGQSYSISIVQPSATSDAEQTPVAMSILADRTITVTNTSYVVGDSAVAAWYNAGDFGNGNLNNNDVNNAFHVSLGAPGYNVFPFTDLFDAMDAFPPDSATTVGGDGQIRYLDWNLILQRSLRLSSPNWQRSWTAGGLRASGSAVLNGAADLPGKTLTPPAPGAVWVRQASFSAASIENAQPGQAVHVPVYVKIDDSSSLSGLQFLAKIQPSALAPSLSAAAQFTPADGFPAGRTVDGLGANQVAYAWDLGSFNPPLRGRVLLGSVTFTVPETAQIGQSYRVRFGNADGAPDENTQYEFESFSAAIWVKSPAPASSDIISDEWKVKFFGSVDSPDAAPDADPDKDGQTNRQEYLAGTDPTNPSSHLHLHAPVQQSNNGKKQLSMRWLTAPGKTYVIETTSNLVQVPWTVVQSGVVGDGNLKEFLDSNPVQTDQYYRVRLQD